MPANTIVHRVFEFLRKYPPFSLMKEDRLLEIAAKIKIKYVDRGQVIFDENDAPGDFLYLVREGSVSLSYNGETVDICDEGDLFGVRSMLSGKPYLLRALSTAESLLYLIPIPGFKVILEQNSQVGMYFAAGLASGQAILRDESSNSSIADKYQLKASPAIMGAAPGHKTLITCKKNETISDVAKVMRHHNIGSMVITGDRGAPIGIITDTDLRKKVATGEYPVNVPVEAIMNSPVITMKKGATLIEMMITMMTGHIHHLCITEDGTDQSKAVGIYSERDMLLAQGNHPAILVKEISKAGTLQPLPALRDKAEKLLQQYLQQGVSISIVAKVMTIINDVLIRKAISFGLDAVSKEFNDPGLKFCWLSLGSEGREEQLLRTDVDNAILYENPPGDKRAEVKEYFLSLGRYVNDVLMQCGFAKCPADIMASNPAYCLSLQEWEQKFYRWINAPDPQALMNGTIFFDFRAVYGDPGLEKSLQEYLVSSMAQAGTFINHLAKNALQNPPPLTFFKNFVVEKGGEHKDEFDVKKRAMMPLADAARVLILHHGHPTVHHTAERFKELAALEPKQADLFNEAGMAYEWLMGLRTRFGLAQQDSGRFLPIESLNKLEKQMLRNSFVPIKELQKLLEVRFQLDYFRT